MHTVLHREEEWNAFDLETGEPDSNASTLLLRKTRFSIPKELLKPPADDAKKSCCIDRNETFTLFKKEEVINLQEVRFRAAPSCVVRTFFLVLMQFSKIPGNYSRMQQNQSSPIPHPNFVHIHTHLCAVDFRHRDLPACLGPSQELAKHQCRHLLPKSAAHNHRAILCELSQPLRNGASEQAAR